MKKALISILIYFLVLHVILPGIYYIVCGFTPIYSEFSDNGALIKSFCLLFFSIVLSILILYFIPSEDDRIEPKIDGSPISYLFYLSIIFKLIIIFLTGGFSGFLAGENNGTLTNYISLFLNPFTLLLVLLFVQRKKSNALFAIFFYVLSVTLSGSRSGIISIFFVFFIGFAFKTFDFYKKKMWSFLKYGLFITPFLFVFATQLRGVEDIVSLDVILNQIVGRMSTLETSMMPVYNYDQNLDLELFYEKFSFWNQFLLSVDMIVPGQLFEYDVMPNNYYRAIFMGYSKSFVIENYMSVNLGLPIYLYLKYSYLSIVLTVLYITGYYMVLRFFKKHPYIVIVLLSGFYNLIYFFDWVMCFSQIYTAILTIILLKCYVFLVREIKLNIRKDDAS